MAVTRSIASWMLNLAIVLVITIVLAHDLFCLQTWTECLGKKNLRSRHYQDVKAVPNSKIEASPILVMFSHQTVSWLEFTRWWRKHTMILSTVYGREGRPKSMKSMNAVILRNKNVTKYFLETLITMSPPKRKNSVLNIYFHLT